MLVFGSIFLLICLDYVTGNNTCRQNPLKICLKKDFELTIPENQKGLTEICDDFKSSFRCMVNFIQFCQQTDTKEEEEIFQFVADSCEQNSTVYKGIANNLECIRSAFLNELPKCAHTDDKYAEVFFMYLINLSGRGITEAADDNKDAKNCVDSMFRDGCSAAVISKKCGVESRNSVVAILQKMDPDLRKCRKVVIDDLMNLVERFESVV